MVRTTCARSIAGLSVIAAIVVSCDKPQTLEPAGPAEQFIVSIAPERDSVALGATLTLNATVRDARGTVRGDQAVIWSSLGPQIASVDNIGLVTGLAVGTAQVVARVGTNADTATVLVQEGSLVLSVAPELVEIMLGDSIQLEAALSTPSGAAVRGGLASVQWSSSDTAIAAIGADGLVTSLTEGDVTFTATVGGVSAVALARVIANPVISVSVTPANSGLYPGQVLQLVTTIRDIRGRVMRNIHVRWSSSDPSVASVSANGLLTAKARGAVIITAATDAMKASATVNVFAVPASGVVVTAPSNTVTRGGQLQAVATVRDREGHLLTGKVVAWSSSNPSVAQVGANGAITGLTIGNTSIHAVVDSKIGTLPISVTGATPTAIAIIPGSATIALGATAHLTAEVKDQGGNVIAGQSMSWSSANPSIATVNGAGVVTGVGAGTANIQVTSGALSAQATINVIGSSVASVSITPSIAQLAAGGTRQLSAAAFDGSGNQIPNAAVSWSSSNPTVATISASGLVTAIGAGSAIITATSSGKTASAAISVASPAPAVVASVSVTFNSPSLLVGQLTQAQAVARDAAGNVVSGRSVTWLSDDAPLASVSANGLVTALASGSATIVAKIDGVIGTATVTISAAAQLPVHSVQLSVSPSTINAGQTASSSVVLRDSLGSVLKNLTVGWSSSKTTVASVGLGGVITGVSAGAATITATSQGKSGAAGVTVNGTTVPVATVSVTASGTNLTIGQTSQAAATTKDAGGNVLTGRPIVWSSSNASVATVSSSGRVTAVAAGSAQIVATSGGKTGSLSFTVVAAPVTIASVTVTLGSSSIAVGTSTQATAVAKDVTGNTITGVTFFWSSSSAATASVNGSGIVAGVAQGSANIAASVAGKTGSAAVSVTGSPVPSGPVPSIPPTLPQQTVNTAWPTTTRTLVVNAGGNLQAALDSAKRGDELVLAAGATFTGNFTAKPKSGTGVILVRSSALGQLPPLGSRIDHTIHAQHMPKIVTPNTAPALEVVPGAHGWRFVGIEVTATANAAVFPITQWRLFWIGRMDQTQKTAGLAPSNIVLDRVYVHGHPTLNSVGCVALNGGATAIIDSQILECHAKGYDSQAIAGNNGPGPYLIENNRLEGAGENIIFGGGDPHIPNLVTSDITIRRNYLVKPLAWKPAAPGAGVGPWTVKNLFELKNAQRVLFEGNVLENNWVDGQAGSAIALASVNQTGGCSWCIVADVTIQYNHINNSAAGFNIWPRCGTVNGNYVCGVTPQQTRRIKIAHNLLTNIGAPGLGANGSVARVFLIQDDVHDIWIEYNTGFAPYSYVTFSGTGSNAKQRFTFRGNIGGGAQYNWFSSGGQGDAANTYSLAPGFLVANNAFVAPSTAMLPSGSVRVASLSSAGFMNPVASLGNWTLQSSSPFIGVGPNGGVPGVNYTALAAKIAGVAK